jgi:hypothetical protein
MQNSGYVLNIGSPEKEGKLKGKAIPVTSHASP